MQSWKCLVNLCVLFSLPGYSVSANIETIWGKPQNFKALKQFHFNNAGANNKASSDINTYQFLKQYTDIHGDSHIRYQQTYRGIPVFGYQLIYFTKKNRVTGLLADSIDEDIKSIKPRFSGNQVLNSLMRKFSRQNSKTTFRRPHASLIIYIHNNKARLAYFAKFYAQTPHKQMQPSYIIDANSREVLSQWDNLAYETIGQGLGGNSKSSASLPDNRDTKYQFGDSQGGLIEELGKLNLTRSGTTCSTENENVRVINMLNVAYSSVPKPIPAADDATYPVFTYTCTAGSQYVNNDDGATLCGGSACAPVNGGFSPINDALYFANSTITMLSSIYGLTNQVGSDLPVRVYTHLADENNAVAIYTERNPDGSIISHNQMIIGNGNATEAYPLTQGTIGHEYAHLVTFNYSALIYSDQSGGMNEAFSDITEMAMKEYVQSIYTWYAWNWTVGIEESKTSSPTRYMYDPPLDGNSIDNAANYYPGLDVHYSSGIFNKAFYLLGNASQTAFRNAYVDFLLANTNYWVEASTFDYGACGVEQAAIDNGHDLQAVVNAFQQVGVTCKVGLDR